MSDEVEESGEPEGVRVEALFSWSDSGEIEITQMFFGMRPGVLITPEADGNDLVLQVKVVDLKPKHLVDTLRLIADAVENAGKRDKKEKKAAKAALRAQEASSSITGNSS